MPGAIVRGGERVALRTFEREDFDLWQRGAADPELRFLTGNSKVRNRDQLEEVFEDENVTTFLVCLEDEADPGPVDVGAVRRIGIVSVKEYTRNPILGIWILPEFHREGYGEEAGSLLVDYTFRVYDTPTVKAKAFDYNAPSRGLLEKLGFQEEGRLRKNAFIDGEYRDGIMYGILREEWSDSTQLEERSL